MAAGEAGGLNLADNGEVDAAVGCHPVANIHVGSRCAADGTIRTDAVTTRTRHVESEGQFWVLAGDFDTQFVIGLDDEVFGFAGLVQFTGLEVFQIYHLVPCSARGDGQKHRSDHHEIQCSFHIVIIFEFSC